MKKKIFLTGSSGFLGQNFKEKFKDDFSFKFYKRELEIKVDCQIVVHLAGIAHDTKNKKGEKDYFLTNTELTKSIFNKFLGSNAKIFIFLSSVKAIADCPSGVLFEDSVSCPKTHYGKSKLKAEEYILSHDIPNGKRVYVLRPCMIHGPGNKGNLNLLFKVVSKNIPWPLGAFENKRSFCSIDNLMFIFRELIEREDIPSGIYNIADDEPLSTNELIELMSLSKNRAPKILNISKRFIEGVSSLGDKFHLPFNTERLHKLTSSYVVNNDKIKAAIGKPLPLSSREGLLKTFETFNSQ
ncbi:NAD-dependent epimerase/dehydratase family protein [Flavobacterium sp.]|uniref:NAD-dependent epimerase/dehydratase family protein n=1 Tax=Flavobacterium sp. TaxID=239 RepID=UPI004047A69D